MDWLALLTIAAFLGSIPCVENYNYGFGRPEGNFNPNSLFNPYSNYGSIPQPSSHWNYNGYGNNNVYEDFPGDETDGFEEDDSHHFDDDDDSDYYPQDDSSHSYTDSLDDDEKHDQNYDLEVNELGNRAHGKSGLELLPALKNQLSSLSSGLVSKQVAGTKSSQITEDPPKYDLHTSDEEITLSKNGYTTKNTPKVVADTSNKEIKLQKNFEFSKGSFLDNHSFQSRNKVESAGDKSNFLEELLRTGIKDAILSGGLNRGISKIGDIRNSVLDFRDKALDKRVGTAQRYELNQFDPKFQASLSKNNRGSTVGDDQISWNKLRDLVPKFETSTSDQHGEDSNKSSKSGFLSLLGNVKGAVASSLNRGGGKTNDNLESSQSENSGFLSFLRNANKGAESSSSNEGNDSKRGRRFQFLKNAKNFVVDPVDFVEREIRNRIKQKIKNEIKQTVGDLTNRVVEFKSNMTGIVNEVKGNSKSKSSGKTNRKCLNIVTGSDSNQLYLNGKRIPDARIIYVDKGNPKDFHSCPIVHQDEVLKDCLLKGNILLLSQPDHVKVEEEHGRQLELIIAKDVVKDRVNGIVDSIFKNFGTQVLKGIHFYRSKNNDE